MAKTDKMTIINHTEMVKQGFKIEVFQWSDGSFGLKLWDGRHLWHDSETGITWDLTQGQEDKQVSGPISSQEFLKRFTMIH